MSLIWEHHAARQLEDRPTGWRDYCNWAVALAASMALWALGGMAAIDLGWWR